MEASPLLMKSCKIQPQGPFHLVAFYNMHRLVAFYGKHRLIAFYNDKQRY